jgi:hypothetical protein
MVTLRCPCEQGHDLCGERWWTRGQYRWVFFDDLQTSDTYSEQVMHCPECGRQLERKTLRSVKPVH